MNDNGKNKTLNNIEKAMLEGYINDPGQAKEDLEAAGINVDTLVYEGMDIVNQYKFKQLASENKNKLQTLLVKAKELLAAKAKIDRSQALAILSGLQVKVQYRNIVNFSDEELNEVLKDVDIVKLIEELEK